MKIQVSLDKGAYPIEREHKTDVGYDLRVKDDTTVYPGRNILGTGVHIAIPVGCTADIRPRSGFSAKGFNNGFGGRFDADVLYGTVDPDYRGELGIIVKSQEDMPFKVKGGTKVAQLVIINGIVDAELEIVKALSPTERGNKGFGG